MSIITNPSVQVPPRIAALLTGAAFAAYAILLAIAA